MQKKVLFVIESLGGGGAEKVLTTLLRHLDKSEYNITLCTIINTGNYIDEVKPYVNYTSVISLPHNQSILDKVWYTIKYKLVYELLPISWVYKLFIPKDNDIEIAFCEGFTTKLMSKSSNKKAKKIAWVHIDLKFNPWSQRLGIYRNIEEETLTYSKFDSIITVSNTVKQSFKEVYGQGEKLVTIYNPIDVYDIKQRGKENIDGYNRSILNIVTVGRLTSQKGYDILLQIVTRLKDEGYKFMLRILGEGVEREKLLYYKEQNGLQNYVELIGFKKNPYPYIANSDLFVCSSRSEGYSLVIAESLVLGIPVLSTYCSGPNELLDEGKYGKLVKNDSDGNGLYEGLKQFLNNKELLEKYHQKAIERGKCFSLTKTINEVEKILNQ
jgi:glycosyltransferase involved in cell wall biosynthesis